ncbi:DNA (cytosine-5)-methyltransferase 1 [Pedobacter sp. AK017]|uniref:DNA cytosine methyltransferase n=1 Tax=Pedobacter sp. AK017 TaxID=2723073 RepID=UPI0016079BAB|nr:DNA cytosine methyltransferase [Pedobacter sp. AK017]MBB5438547.1 DNA (cytosine-5)-methyltransferase 1 [Pedobacter sp. AK017]
MPNNPKIIDLFSGVGGLSLGAAKANFELAGAVEFEKRIIDCHARNFPKSNHICADVSTLSGKKLLENNGLRLSELAGIVGGPPCQGFSSMGKGNPEDKRNQLFSDFFRIVSEAKPVFFMAENVPGILQEKYSEIRENAIRIVEKEYEVFQPIKIIASEYGGATTRTRVFFIGFRKDVNYSGNLLDEIYSLKVDSLSNVNQALEGLPIDISEDWSTFGSSWQKVQKMTGNSYLRSLNEVIEGVGDDDSITRYLKRQEVSGCFGTKHSKEVSMRYANLKPGEQDNVSKSIKLKQYGLCPTLRAGTDSTKGSFQAVRPIHPTQPRVITPREAARLQGFPDWFQFHETKWHSFRLIGNSVCPVAAEKILRAIKSTLNM